MNPAGRHDLDRTPFDPMNEAKSKPGNVNDPSHPDDSSHLNMDAMRAAASAAMVNRTHRVIRQRAQTIQDRKNKVRSLWIPLLTSGGLLAVIVTAIWSVLDQYELEPTGWPDASQQMFVLVMWCLPLSALLLAVVWMRRNGPKPDNWSGR